jgi:hypothetical protein
LSSGTTIAAAIAPTNTNVISRRRANVVSVGSGFTAPPWPLGSSLVTMNQLRD